MAEVTGVMGWYARGAAAPWTPCTFALALTHPSHLTFTHSNAVPELEPVLLTTEARSPPSV